jgi:FkbM family methyltransferase
VRLRPFIDDFTRLVTRLGVGRALYAKVASAVFERLCAAGSPYRVPWSGVAGFVWLRAGTSDHKVYKQILIEGELDPLNDLSPKTVLDGGANIGLSAVAFATAFGEATVVCVEPDDDNIEMIRRNTARFSDRIFVVKGALWGHSTRLRIENPTREAWAFQVFEDPNGQIVAHSIPDLIRKFSLDGGFDVVKLDIEGSEREVFSGELSWMKHTRVVAVELHDWMTPGIGDSARRAFEDGGWSRTQKGEYQFYWNTRA